MTVFGDPCQFASLCCSPPQTTACTTPAPSLTPWRPSCPASLASEGWPRATTRTCPTQARGRLREVRSRPARCPTTSTRVHRLAPKSSPWWAAHPATQHQRLHRLRGAQPQPPEPERHGGDPGQPQQLPHQHRARPLKDATQLPFRGCARPSLPGPELRRRCSGTPPGSASFPAQPSVLEKPAWARPPAWEGRVPVNGDRWSHSGPRPTGRLCFWGPCSSQLLLVHLRFFKPDRTWGRLLHHHVDTL